MPRPCGTSSSARATPFPGKPLPPRRRASTWPIARSPAGPAPIALPARGRARRASSRRPPTPGASSARGLTVGLPSTPRAARPASCVPAPRGPARSSPFACAPRPPSAGRPGAGGRIWPCSCPPAATGRCTSARPRWSFAVPGSCCTCRAQISKMAFTIRHREPRSRIPMVLLGVPGPAHRNRLVGDWATSITQS